MRSLSQSLLGALTYNILLQRTATAKYQKSLLAGWTRSGFLRKPDFKKADVETWRRLRGDGVTFNKRFFLLDGTQV